MVSFWWIWICAAKTVDTLVATFHAGSLSASATKWEKCDLYSCRMQDQVFKIIQCQACEAQVPRTMHQFHRSHVANDLAGTVLRTRRWCIFSGTEAEFDTWRARHSAADFALINLEKFRDVEMFHS